MCDFVVLNALMYAFYKVNPFDIMPKFFLQSPRVVLLLSNIAMALSQYMVPPIIHRRALTFEQITARVLSMTILQLIMMFTLIRLAGENGGMFRFMLIFALVFIPVIFLTRIAERMTLGLYRRRGGNTRAVVLIGNDRALAQLYQDLMTDASTGYKVRGYYSDKKSEYIDDKIKYLGTISDFQREANEINENKSKNVTKDGEQSVFQNLDDVFCSLSHEEGGTIFNIMKCCDNCMIHFFYVPRSFGNYHINLKPEGFGHLTVYTNHREPLTNVNNRILKRAFDIPVSAVVCLVMLPLIPIIAAIIKLQSPGPVFFKQARTGINGKTFICYKFRSMHLNKDADMQQASLDDPRKFPFGRFIRKFNIDEFPQFFNVLKGDMSIVGPRPHMLYHTDVYRKLVDGYMVRHFCKPGITGWAQVTGYRGETKELWQMEERVKHDIWYIENWTMWLDLKIIFMTAFGLIKPDKNAY